MSASALASGALALVTAGFLTSAEPAFAQQGLGNIFGYQQPRQKRYGAKKRRAPAEDTAESAAPAKADGKAGAKKEAEKAGPKQPVYVVVSLADQHASIYDADGLVTRTRVSTGQAGHRTPTGVFTVIGKERWHRSNIYSGAPMPWMQRITWSGVAMHAGVVPGYPASHGCIRLPAGFAPQLYGMTKMGARVVVSPGDATPVDFSHPLLPLPKMQVAPVVAALPHQLSPSEAKVELASVGSPTTTTAMGTTTAPAPEAAADRTKLLNPIDYASALKARAVADKTVADQAAKEALAAAQTAGAEARQAVEDVRKADAGLRAAEAKIAALDAPVSAVTPVAVSADATAAASALDTARTTAHSELARAQAALDEARSRDAAKTPAAFAAVETWKRTVATAEAAKQLVEEGDRRREQVSVFISRKEGRIFIRQDWKEVWEAPITIRDPDRPIGTHIYTAVDAAADGSSMRWTAISMPPERPAEARRSRSKDDEQQPAAPAGAPETAASALDRIELPEGARERIAELLWAGGSLIVSDYPRSGEMSEYSDFIVLTRG